MSLTPGVGGCRGRWTLEQRRSSPKLPTYKPQHYPHTQLPARHRGDRADFPMMNCSKYVDAWMGIEQLHLRYTVPGIHKNVFTWDMGMDSPQQLTEEESIPKIRLHGDPTLQ